MPIYSPRRLGPRSLPRRFQYGLCGLIVAAGLFLTFTASAQTLAHPNWVGNGMSTDPWYQHAVIYRLDSTTAAGGAGQVDFKYLASRINAVRTVGIDALLLPAPMIPAGADGPASPQIDQLDDLVRVASNRGVRILLTLKAPSASADLTGVARFWLSRGVAGFYVDAPAGSNTAEMQASLQLLRRQVASVVGQRIVISSLDLVMPDGSVGIQPAAPIVRRMGGSRVNRSTDTAPQLEIDSRLDRISKLDAAMLRPMLSQTVGQAGLLVDFDPAKAVATGTSASAAGTNGKGLSEIRAAIALITHPAALIESDAKLVLEPTPEHVEAEEEQPKPAPAPVQTAPGVFLPYKPYVAPKKAVIAEVAPKDPLTIWYKQLASLHHTNAAFRSGNATFLDFDAQNALVWVARPATVTNIAPALVVACNLSGSAVTLSVKGQVEGMGLKGNYLRTLLRSDNAMGPQDLNAVTLPPYSVYVGEVRK